MGISSSGLISAKAVLDCTPCCPTTCNSITQNNPECAACKACNMQGTACPKASAAKCADGSSPGSNGCCAATLECPPCIYEMVATTSPTPSAESTTCTCTGCAGETVTFDATCTSDSCSAMTPRRSGMKALECEYCSGSDGTCMPNQAAADACSSSMFMQKVSISSSGLISAKAVLDCTPCCPTTCNSITQNNPECAACKACNMQGTACPKDSAAASLSSGALGTTLLAVTTTA